MLLKALSALVIVGAALYSDRLLPESEDKKAAGLLAAVAFWCVLLS